MARMGILCNKIVVSLPLAYWLAISKYSTSKYLYHPQRCRASKMKFWNCMPNYLEYEFLASKQQRTNRISTYPNRNPLHGSVRLRDVDKLMLEKFVGSGETFPARGANVILQTLVNLFDVTPEFVLLGKLLRTNLKDNFRELK